MAVNNETLRACFISPNVSDSNWEPANMVDAIDALGSSVERAARSLGNADACTPMGGLEALGKQIGETGELVADALNNVAAAIAEHGE